MRTEERPKGKVRVVLDTNVYISIFTNPKGQLGAIWNHGLSGTYTLLISPAMVAELANVLREKFHWPDEAITARAKRFARIATIITPHRVRNVIANNPADNHILACALSGHAADIPHPPVDFHAYVTPYNCIYGLPRSCRRLQCASVRFHTSGHCPETLSTCIPPKSCNTHRAVGCCTRCPVWCGHVASGAWSP
jgi:predicted nucleic acid-binding protein